MKASIGLNVPAPENQCDDPKCPFHGSISVRGQILEGTVKSASMKQTAVVVRPLKKYLKKYQRYLTRFSSYHAHVPGCISVKQGDTVRIAECRKLAKTVSYVIVEKVVK